MAIFSSQCQFTREGKPSNWFAGSPGVRSSAEQRHGSCWHSTGLVPSWDLVQRKESDDSTLVEAAKVGFDQG